MNHSSASTYCVALLIGAVFLIGLSLSGFKEEIYRSFHVALLYYKQQAKYYFMRYTGRTPPPIITRHPSEWRQFEFIGDALLLRTHELKKLFKDYLAIRKEIFNAKILKSDETSLSVRDSVPGRFFQLNENAAVVFQYKLEEIYPDCDLDFIKDLMGRVGIKTNLELRALRMGVLNEEQREVLRPHAIQLIRSTLKYEPRFPWKEGISIDRVEMVNEKQRFISKVREIITNRQSKLWSKRIVFVQKQLDSDLSRVEKILSDPDKFQDSIRRLKEEFKKFQSAQT